MHHASTLARPRTPCTMQLGHADRTRHAAQSHGCTLAVCRCAGINNGQLTRTPPVNQTNQAPSCRRSCLVRTAATPRRSFTGSWRRRPATSSASSLSSGVAPRRSAEVFQCSKLFDHFRVHASVCCMGGPDGTTHVRVPTRPLLTRRRVPTRLLLCGCVGCPLTDVCPPCCGAGSTRGLASRTERLCSSQTPWRPSSSA